MVKPTGNCSINRENWRCGTLRSTAGYKQRPGRCFCIAPDCSNGVRTYSNLFRCPARLSSIPGGWTWTPPSAASCAGFQFSAGAEFWLKGLCLLHGIDVRKEIEVGNYPTGDIESWASRYNQNWRSDGTIRVASYGTLGSLTWRENNQPSFLDRLMTAGQAAQADRELVRAACHLLGRSIRNRDAHGYVPNVRDSHHNLVPELFARCLNITAKWLPGGPCTLTTWIARVEGVYRRCRTRNLILSQVSR